MMTEELTYASDTATMSQSFAPPIQASSIVRMETSWGRVSVTAKHHRWPVQSDSSKEVSRPHCAGATPASHRWGLVLAGGDGVRLRELTQSVWGDYRPKQFCPLLSS